MLQPVKAQIAFLHLAVYAKLRRAIRAGNGALAAADAIVGVHHHDAVFGALRNRACRTYLKTGWLRAMHARYGDVPVSGAKKPVLPTIENPPPARSNFDVIGELAGYVAGEALHAAPGIDVEPELLIHALFLFLLARLGAPL